MVLNEITVKKSALLHNYNYFKKLNPQAQLAPVLKSNAYGHGLIPTAQFIDQNLSQVPFLCVDSLYEAYELYKAGIKTPIFIMGYTDPANYQVWKNIPFIFGVSDCETLLALNKYQPGSRVHLKLDTGMHRLGFTLADLPQLLSTLKHCPHLRLEGVFSHLASADDPRQVTATRRQIALFKQMTTLLEAKGYHFSLRHLAATAGSEIIHDPYFNLIRLGLGFYGLSPFGPHTKEGRRERQTLKPALTLTTHVAAVKNLAKGDAVGYGAAYVAKQQEAIAILPLGYNEGISRELSNLGYFILPSKEICPIIGRVSMNMTAIKLPRRTNLKPGASLTLAPIQAQAQLLHTIPYTILTSLHPSIRRTFI